MTQSDALAVQRELENLCIEKGLWYKTEYDCKPNLKMIRIEITLKVEDRRLSHLEQAISDHVADNDDKAFQR